MAIGNGSGQTRRRRAHQEDDFHQRQRTSGVGDVIVLRRARGVVQHGRHIGLDRQPIRPLPVQVDLLRADSRFFGRRVLHGLSQAASKRVRA